MIPDRSLLVIWAAKSASSVTLAWCTKIMGVSERCRAAGLSPHGWRSMCYPSSEAFRRGKRKVLDDYRVVHVIRDPYQRAVASYRHSLAFKFVDKRFASFDTTMDRQTGIPFSRYLDFLETLDLRHTNVHHRLQLHPVERVKRPDYIVNVSKGSLLDQFNRLEDELGLSRTDFAGLKWTLEYEDTRRAKTTAFRGHGIANLPLTAPAARGLAPWPDYDQFLEPSVKRRIERLYAPDFEAFGPYL